MTSPVSLIKKIKSDFHEEKKLYHEGKDDIEENTFVHFGWGKLCFANTYKKSEDLIQEILDEEVGERNLAFYVQDPQKLIYESKGKFFLDPSYSYRLDLMKYNAKNKKPPFTIRFLMEDDIDEVNKLYEKCGALPIGKKSTLKNQYDTSLTYFVAEDEGKIVGVVTGVDHADVFQSPKEGTSLWGLCTSKDVRKKGLGRTLIEYVAIHYKTRGRRFLDLSVLCSNKGAIKLYEKMGFQKMHNCFCIKRKNKINDSLFFS